MTETEDINRLTESALVALPKDNPLIIPWAERNVVLNSSARSKYFNISITPWLREPIEKMVDLYTRTTTMMKPVQSGGSTFGEVVLLYWIMFWRGFIQYNWSNEKRSDERWRSRIKSLLESCPPVAAKFMRAQVNGTDVDFGNVFFRMQGVFVASNLDSDTIPLQINEEVHDWEPGHLKKAEGRSTAVWNYKRGNISNAGNVGDQMDQAHRSGTMQKWEVVCPFCSNPHHEANKVYHVMRERFDAKKPNLGGIVYDSTGAKTGSFDYDYNKIRPTVHIQMPCGGKVHNENLSMRRALSESGRYSEPNNKGALLSNRSYWYDVASVDYIDLLNIIKEKHEALKARAYGDPIPFAKYQRERANVPYDINDVPTMQVTATTSGLKKNRDGLSSPRFRTFELDRQQGVALKGDLPHWWLLIRDFKIVGDRLISQLVYEAKHEMDQDVIAALDEHKCLRWQGVADSGDDTTYVYTFCMRYGINAIKGSATHFFTHENGERRIYSAERPLHSMLNRPPNFPYIEMEMDGTVRLVPDPREPMFWHYSKDGVRERLNYLRAYTAYQTPEDVSEDYKSHQESEERVEHINPLDGTRKWIWNQIKDRNDLFVCECYAAMMADKAGMILEGTAETKKGK